MMLSVYITGDTLNR